MPPAFDEIEQYDGPDRRTGDPWKRQIHGRVDKLERRVGDRDTLIGTLDLRTRMLAKDLQHNTEISERILKTMEPISQVFNDVRIAQEMVESFRDTKGAKRIVRGTLGWFAMIGAAGGGVIAIAWLVVKLLAK